jgi:hypothetical protein
MWPELTKRKLTVRKLTVREFAVTTVAAGVVADEVRGSKWFGSVIALDALRQGLRSDIISRG